MCRSIFISTAYSNKLPLSAMATRSIYTSCFHYIALPRHSFHVLLGTSHRRDRPAAKEAGAQPGSSSNARLLKQQMWRYSTCGSMWSWLVDCYPLTACRENGLGFAETNPSGWSPQDNQLSVGILSSTKNWLRACIPDRKCDPSRTSHHLLSQRRNFVRPNMTFIARPHVTIFKETAPALKQKSQLFPTGRRKIINAPGWKNCDHGLQLIGPCSRWNRSQLLRLPWVSSCSGPRSSCRQGTI